MIYNELDRFWFIYHRKRLSELTIEIHSDEDWGLYIERTLLLTLFEQKHENRSNL